MPDEKIDQKRSVEAEHEPRAGQQRIVDDTVDDSFPASDPPAWTTAGSASVAARCAESDTAEDAPAQSAPKYRNQAKDTVRRGRGRAMSLVRDVQWRGEGALEEARRLLPEAKRYAGEHPIASLVVAGAVGYGLAWLMHARAFTRSGRPYRSHLITDARRRDLEAWEHTQDGADMTVARYTSGTPDFDHRATEGPGW